MDNLRQDLAHGLRRLRQSPGFTLVAVATLALGIGANSAIYSVVSAVLLRPLPYAEPERLVQLSQTWEGRFTEVYSPQNFLDLEAQAKSFESMAAIDGGGVTLTGRGAPVRVESAGVSASFFDVLRVRPALGRAFRRDENEPGQSKVAVLSDTLWRQRFGTDPDVVGQQVQLDRQTYEVIGVAPAAFSYPEGADLWTPIAYDERFRTKSRGAWYLEVIARLEEGVAAPRANDEVATIAQRLAREYPDANEGVGGALLPLQESLVRGSRTALLVLFGAVGLVLLVACVNVANLLLSRMAGREAELAVRSALGAGRGRLVRQLLTESVLLAVLGGGAGLLLASALLDSLLSLQPEGLPRLGEVRIDPAVAGFAALLSISTGLLFGVFPALHATQSSSAQALHDAGRGLLSGRGRRLRGGLVMGQMAMALVLLAGAGLLGRSFIRMRQVDPGFRTDSALTFRIALPETAYPSEARRSAFFDDLLTRLRALPGVREAGAVAGLPLSGTRFSISFTVEGRPPLPPAQQPSMEVRVASTAYLQAMGIPVRRGRGFEPSDRAGTAPVVVISESAARRFFPGQEPLGQRLAIGMGREEGLPRPGGEIVGVVGDVKDRGLSKESLPVVYLAHAQLGAPTLDVLLRTAVSPRSLVPAVEATLHEVDPELPLTRLRTLDEVVSRSVSEPRFYMVLLGAFAAVALLLAALGIFGVLSYAVTQRQREIGIRVALGAHPKDVLRMVLGNALVLILGGLLAGLAGTLALSRTMTSLLFDLSPTDPATLGGVAIVLAAVALLASYLPARRATRVDPLVALRSE